MNKKSNKKRIARDYYRTPPKAIPYLIPFLEVEENKMWAEPCAGDGAILHHFERQYPEFARECLGLFDIEPQDSVAKLVVSGVTRQAPNYLDDMGAKLIVTNPPWSFGMLDPLLKTWRRQEIPAWCLLKGDFAFNDRSREHMVYCTDIVPTERLKWFADSDHTYSNNTAWFRFGPKYATTEFHPRPDVKTKHLPDF